MSEINKDLQATHKILTIVEQSKSHNDELLDKLPGVFAIVDEKAKILRGNLFLSGTKQDYSIAADVKPYNCFCYSILLRLLSNYEGMEMA